MSTKLIFPGLFLLLLGLILFENVRNYPTTDQSATVNMGLLSRSASSTGNEGILLSSTGSATTAHDVADTPRLGFEILHIKSRNEIIVWATMGLTQEEFAAIKLPFRWMKNQPRELAFTAGSMAHSPDTNSEGKFTELERYGTTWKHVATVTEVRIPMDDEEVLTGNKVSKYHTISFSAGTTLDFLIAPTGDQYVLTTRDANRTTDDFALPTGWKRKSHLTEKTMTFELPNPTLNIRTDNEDSYQGPVDF